jgi:hypothetical protein
MSPESQNTTGVWVSAATATIVHWGPDGGQHREIESDVPGRHRSTGRPPTQDHPAGEGHRNEKMRIFFAQIKSEIPTGDDLLLVGDGEVVEHFAQYMRNHHSGQANGRRIQVEKSGPMTEHQLLARVRDFAGSPARRSMPD